MRSFIFAVAAAAAFAAPAHATNVLTDNFNTEDDGPANGGSALNYTGFANWGTTGNVDVVNSGDFGITCSGKCVDLDGTPGPGEIQTLATYAFNAGDIVSLTFALGGSQRGSIENFLFGFRSQSGIVAYNNINISSVIFGNASFGSISSANLAFQGLNIPSAAAFNPVTLSFTAGNAGSFKAYLGSNSSDNVGVLIDDVSINVSAVPEPATWAMMIAGFGLVGGAMRRRKAMVPAAA